MSLSQDFKDAFEYVVQKSLRRSSFVGSHWPTPKTTVRIESANVPPPPPRPLGIADLFPTYFSKVPKFFREEMWKFLKHSCK